MNQPTTETAQQIIHHANTNNDHHHRANMFREIRNYFRVNRVQGRDENNIARNQSSEDESSNDTSTTTLISSLTDNGSITSNEYGIESSDEMSQNPPTINSMIENESKPMGSRLHLQPSADPFDYNELKEK